MTIRDAVRKLKPELIKRIDSALTNEVYQKVVEVQQEAIEDTVYSTQTSGAYERRGADGGLSDPKNIVIVGGRAENGLLVVENITKPNPFLNGLNKDDGVSSTPLGSHLAGIIEYGLSNGDYAYDYWKNPKARPFIAETKDALKRTGAHKYALAKGLMRQSVKIKV